MVNDFSRTENGVVTFAASQGRETREERPAWGHGAFTQALIEGLGEGKADLLHNGSITVSELDDYIAERVKTLTDGHQHPVMSRPTPCRISPSRWRSEAILWDPLSRLRASVSTHLVFLQ